MWSKPLLRINQWINYQLHSPLPQSEPRTTTFSRRSTRIRCSRPPWCGWPVWQINSSIRNSTRVGMWRDWMQRPIVPSAGWPAARRIVVQIGPCKWPDRPWPRSSQAAGSALMSLLIFDVYSILHRNGFNFYV